MMKKYFLILIALFGMINAVSAQNEHVQLNVPGGTSSIKFAYRLTEANGTLSVDYGNDEIDQVTKATSDELNMYEYAFKTTSADDRVVTIDASNLVVLRFTSSRSINGIKGLESSSLLKLNCDFTKLSETTVIDFSKCPNIEEITLNESLVEEVVLPEQPKLKTFQVSSPLFGRTGFKKIDLTKCTALETVSLKNIEMLDVDLRACPNLKKLVISGLSNKKYPVMLRGAKAMKHLELVNISFCAFSYDMLPDLNETRLEFFKIGKMYYCYTPKSSVNELTVDLSYMKEARGLSTTMQPTTFTWKIKGSDKKWSVIPTDKYTVKDGVFTFDQSLLTDGKATVRAQVFNPGYPDINFYKSGLHTYNITLTAPAPAITLTVTNESPGVDEDGYEIEEIDVTLKVAADKADQSIQIDWGYGPQDYTIAGDEANTITQTVDLGATIKIYSTNLTQLDATRSKLVAVDFTPKASTLSVLRLSQNKIATIDLTNMPQLHELMITDNSLETLDVTMLTELKELYCGYNQFSELNVAKNTQLDVLNCNNNKLKQLDVTTLDDLKVLVVSANPLEGAIDLSHNDDLITLDVEQCGLTELTLYSNDFKRLVLGGNQLTQILCNPVERMEQLYYVDLRNNQMDACAINDFCMYLTDHVSDDKNIDTSNLLKVKGNSGAETYDHSLVPVTDDAAVLWNVDVEGDATGCATAKVFSLVDDVNGTAVLKVAGEAKAFAEAIDKNSTLTFVLTPNEGYEVSEVTIDMQALTLNENQEGYDYQLQKNCFFNCSFGIKKGVDRPTSSMVITQQGEFITVSGLTANAHYNVYKADGVVVSNGVVGRDGVLSLNLRDSGLYLIQVDGQVIKLYR